MGLDYAFVHLKYTIPPALALTFAYYPLRTPLGLYKIAFLVIIAIVATIPWDSYLIRTRVWTYPPDAVIGPAIFSIPIEEVFFFFIQTYITTLIYLIISKPTFHPVYLRGKQRLLGREDDRQWRWLGTAVILGSLVMSIRAISEGGKGLYMGLITVWAGSFILLLWNLAYQLILGAPASDILVPIAVSTSYLWLVDTLALRRGTWVIESGTKLEWHLWDGLDIEEAFFFLVTNILVVFGLVAFDNATAILNAFPSLFPTVPALPSPVLLVRALLVPTSQYDDFRISGLAQALARLRAKSRSFYLASGTFEGRLRVDLILLYSFYRLADDLVDDAESTEDAQYWTEKLVRYLDLAYAEPDRTKANNLTTFIDATFPESTRATLKILPTTYLSAKPLYDLIKGFEMDLHFPSNSFPIADEATLQTYAARVAGTVAESCLDLVYYHTPSFTPNDERKRILQSGVLMGIALQYVNIARDIAVDASRGRVYIPTSWLKEMDLTPADLIRDPHSEKVDTLRHRVLDKAMTFYLESRDAIEELPAEAQGPMRVAVESYIEIGIVLRQKDFRVKAGRATVSKLRRITVAWRALQGR